MADIGTAIHQFFASLLADPLYLFLVIGLVALGLIALVAAAMLVAAIAAAEDAPPAADPPPGQLLIAAAGMQDPRFHHSVILLLRHDETGAFGIAINRPVGEHPPAPLPAGPAGQAGGKSSPMMATDAK